MVKGKRKRDDSKESKEKLSSPPPSDSDNGDNGEGEGNKEGEDLPPEPSLDVTLAITNHALELMTSGKLTWDQALSAAQSQLVVTTQLSKPKLKTPPMTTHLPSIIKTPDGPHSHKDLLAYLRVLAGESMTETLASLLPHETRTIMRALHFLSPRGWRPRSRKACSHAR